jgi:hypothetical protein
MIAWHKGRKDEEALPCSHAIGKNCGRHESVVLFDGEFGLEHMRVAVIIRRQASTSVCKNGCRGMCTMM